MAKAPTTERPSARRSALLVADLEADMREQCAKLSRGHDLAKAMNYMFKRWGSLTRFLDDGRVCLSNNAAERAPRGVALGRKSWLFCGSDRGGRRAAAMYSLIVTAKMNGVDPQAWLTDILARIAAHPAHRLEELLPWNGRAEHWATIASLIETCKIDDVNPLDYLTDVIARIVNGHPNSDIDQLLPWAYRKPELQAVA